MTNKSEFNNSKLGANIKSLREFYGITQDELAMDIGLGKESRTSIISQYESGKRIPSRETLSKIAKRFGFVENELIYGDYTKMPKLYEKPFKSKKYQKSMFEAVLPIITSENALKNINFKEGVVKHERLYNGILAGNYFDENEFNKCLELYINASDENIIEARANYLWWLMFFGLWYTFFTPKTLYAAELFQDNKGSAKQMILSFLPSIEDENDEEMIQFSKDRAEFINDSEIDLLANIAILKKSQYYSELGDYYLALLYILGLRNNMSKEMAYSIGNELMALFAGLGNKYAKAFMKAPDDNDKSQNT